MFLEKTHAVTPQTLQDISHNIDGEVLDSLTQVW